MLTFTETIISQEGDKHGENKSGTEMGDTADTDPSVPPSALDQELAWRLIDKVSRLNQAGHSAEVHQLTQLGDYIRSVRRRLKLSRAELEIRSGLPRSFLIAVENGLVTREEVSLNKLNRLSASLSIPPDTLEAFLYDPGLADCAVSAVETDKRDRRRLAMDRMMQLMKSVANMSRMRKIMVMMVMGTLLVAVIAMSMSGKEMIFSGM